MARTQSTDPPPRLKDRYRLVEWLGEGNMGVVYRAHDEVLRRDVAIKFLSPKLVVGDEVGARFLREARVVAGLSHANIMTLFDMGREGDWHYLVLEYIPGHNLHTLTVKQGGALPVDEALRIIQGVLKALAYAHANGVLHRDIKPENMLLTPDGQVKVADFGLSLAQGDVRLTQEDVILGTVLYLAPEVVAGAPPDCQADLYAVGAVLYELLTGRPPFISDNPMTTFSQILNAPVTPPSAFQQSISPELERVILKLLSKDPAERYASADETLAALSNLREIEASGSPQGSSSLVERIMRASSATHRKLEKDAAPDEATPPPPRTEALLVYAAFEDTIAAVEAERRRLAGLLNRKVIEQLNLLLSQAGAYEQTLGGNPSARMAVSVLSSLARQIIQDTRDLEANLHPAVLETLGLEPALESLANQTIRAHGLQINLNLERMPARLSRPIELALFRMTQDALERATQHAHASQVAIHLAQNDERIVLNLFDNGIAATDAGMDMLQAAWRRIEQLGGAVESSAGGRGGLELSIAFPIEAPLDLTPREMEVIELLVEGLSNKEIARLLSISPRTVNFHLDNIYSKLGVNSRTEAAIYAMRRGWMRQL